MLRTVKSIFTSQFKVDAKNINFDLHHLFSSFLLKIIARKMRLVIGLLILTLAILTTDSQNIHRTVNRYDYNTKYNNENRTILSFISSLEQFWTQHNELAIWSTSILSNFNINKSKRP